MEENLLHCRHLLVLSFFFLPVWKYRRSNRDYQRRVRRWQSKLINGNTAESRSFDGSAGQLTQSFPKADPSVKVQAG